MTRGGKDKKEATNAETIRRQNEEFNAWLARIETMDTEELREYARQNKDEFCSQKRAAIKKLLQKNKEPKKRKKRNVLSPIIGAVMKFHKKDDDDDDPPADACAA